MTRRSARPSARAVALVAGLAAATVLTGCKTGVGLAGGSPVGAAGKADSTAGSSRPDPVVATTTSREPSRYSGHGRRALPTTPPTLPGTTTSTTSPTTSRTSTTTSATSSTTTTSSPTSTSPVPSAGGVYWGAAGDVSTLSAKTGQPLATHAYASFSGKVPTARMITVTAPGTWAGVANVQPGSALYNDIVRWADTIKARGGNILFAYQHEPEVTAKTSLGGPEDFKAAYRKVVSIFRQRGVKNVTYTWQMTAWAFRAPATDRQHAAAWYPGDAYVDVVGADAYNWNTCGHGRDRWVELSTLTNPVIAFAKAHGKKAALPEFASNNSGNRSAWLDNAHTFLKANDPMIVAAFYFNRGPTNPANSDCDWALHTSAEYAAYDRIANDTSVFRP